MNELIDKKLYDLLIKFFPQKYAHLNIIENLGRLHIELHKSKDRALGELQIHKESMEKNNIVSMGFGDLINKLLEIRDESVCIIHGNNDEYGFDIYLNNQMSDRLGFLLIRRRKKAKEEILWEKNLGIHSRRKLLWVF